MTEDKGKIESVLYVGSGKSALMAPVLAGNVDLICAVNNAWRVFPSGVDYWIYPGDFPLENFPPPFYRCKMVEYLDFKDSAENVFSRLGEKHAFPQHKAGYTIFFQGLYWIFDTIRPSRIYTIGFDHDFSPEKVDRWVSLKCPAPNNKFNGMVVNSVNEWASSFFDGMEPDSFYGHGTPDPMRLGEHEIREFFCRSLDCSRRLGIELFNASGITEGLNNFPQSKP